MDGNVSALSPPFTLIESSKPVGTVGTALIDTTTQGNWLGTYGSDGPTTSARTPAPTTPPSRPMRRSASPVSPTISGPPRPPTQPPWQTDTPTLRTAPPDAWYSPTSFTIDINLTDGQVHRVALYALDWDNYGRKGRRSMWLTRPLVPVLDERDAV